MGHYASEMNYPPEPLTEAERDDIETRVAASIAKYDQEKNEALACKIKDYLQREHRQRVSLHPLQQMIRDLRLAERPKPFAERLAEFDHESAKTDD